MQSDEPKTLIAEAVILYMIPIGKNFPMGKQGICMHALSLYMLGTKAP